MPLDALVATEINNYVNRDLPPFDWYEHFFDFVRDPILKQRLAEAFMATRLLYKILEGIQASDLLLREEVRLQILQYASIYEAVLHYILFDQCAADVKVKRLLETPVYKRVSVSKVLDKLVHQGHRVYTMRRGTARRDVTKVRFEDKARVAQELGFIDKSLGDELVKIYSTRNAVHLHAELRKGISYELQMSTLAYRRMQPFRDQVSSALLRRETRAPSQ